MDKSSLLNEYGDIVVPAKKIETSEAQEFLCPDDYEDWEAWKSTDHESDLEEILMTSHDHDMLNGLRNMFSRNHDGWTN